MGNTVGYISEALLNTLKSRQEDYCCGFIVIIDIKNSTLRKVKHNFNWYKQTEALYQGFATFSNNLGKLLKKTCEIKVTKYIGDAMMVFIELKNSNHPGEYRGELPKNEAKIVFNAAADFVDYIKELKELERMKLKTVITFLDDIRVIEIENHPKFTDALGRGIDFSFRLEKFADTSHVVVNERMYQALADDEDIKKEYALIPVHKKIKGWDNKGGELFYIITNLETIRMEIEEYIPTPYEDNVKTEVLSHYVKEIQKVINKLQNELFENQDDAKK